MSLVLPDSTFQNHTPSALIPREALACSIHILMFVGNSFLPEDSTLAARWQPCPLPPPALGTQPWTKTLRPWPTRGGYWASRTVPRSRSAPSRSVTLNKGIGSDGASLVSQMVKSLPEMQETQVWSLGQEDPLEKGMATHCSILAWRVPWTEEPGGLQSVRSQRVRHNWATNNFTFIRSDIFQVVKWQKINSEQLKKKGKKKLWATGSSSNILIRHLGRSPGGGHGNPQQYSCLENPNGQRSLVGYSPWGCKELDMTEWLSTTQDMHTYMHTCVHMEAHTPAHIHTRICACTQTWRVIARLFVSTSN